MNRTDYPSPKPFRQAARSHQRLWLRNYLNVESTDHKRVLLPHDKAYVGQNFFSDQVCEIVQGRYPNAFYPNSSGRPRILVGNALRSEHIPFNLFAPLSNYLKSDNLAAFFSTLTGIALTAIDQIYFEYAEQAASSRLGDNTTFDAYAIARQGDHRYAVCIEVKFTEGSYSWGATEKRRMFDASDSYVQLSEASTELQPRAFENLRNLHLKQIWRNFLLGVVTAEYLACDFVYMHFYPEGNHYQAAVCSHFAQNLTNKGLSTFRPTTYENFLNAAKDQLNDDLSPWIQYIDQRYIVPTI